ncbi:S1 family peptidase [Bowmanella denitrificans]|uniref:S1 family peptidase n=1 Tax=Bowmanella denitrificans TaxID=366582 RepID=UPI001FECD830|nr:serine protease [Bowmanella denitrificans]
MKNILTIVLFLLSSAYVSATDFENLVKNNKSAVVGVGIFDPLGSPRSQLQGTGFAIGDGTLVATNFHVVERALEEGSQQRRVVFIGTGNNPQISQAEIVKTDPAHDLAILRIEQKVANVLSLSTGGSLPDGREVAFTGYPIGAVLGLYPATHKGMVAATTPVVIPSANAQQLSLEVLKRLREPFMVYQLDATAYPGNSGSPVYDVKTGEVVAIINKVFVKESKESALSAPSGITYAIPVKYLRDLLAEASL